MKAARNLAIGKVAFRVGPSSPSTREGCARIGADEGWHENTASTAVAAPIPSEIR
jgi:hypothetical protein